jgi:hypothetical protein
MGDKPDRSVRWLDWIHEPIGTVALTFFLLVLGGILAVVALGFYKSQVEFGISFGTYVPATLAVLALVAGLAFGLRAWVLLLRVQKERLAALRADSLPERAKQAADVLREATTLVQELQDELTARTALLEDVQRRVAEGSRQADDLEKLSHVDNETARAFNNLLDEALKRRLEELERGARQREWFIGTVVAVPVSIIAILFSHFVLGF